MNPAPTWLDLRSELQEALTAELTSDHKQPIATLCRDTVHRLTPWNSWEILHVASTNTALARVNRDYLDTLSPLSHIRANIAQDLEKEAWTIAQSFLEPEVR